MGLKVGYAMAFAIRWDSIAPICWRMAMTSALFKSRWVTRRGDDDNLYSYAESRQSERSGVPRIHSERRDSIYTDPHKTAQRIQQSVCHCQPVLNRNNSRGLIRNRESTGGLSGSAYTAFMPL